MESYKMSKLKKSVVNLYILLFLISAVCIPAPVSAQQTPENLYSLQQIIAIALENNLSLEAAKYKLKAADWGVKKAYSEFLPKLAFNQRLTKVDDFSVWNANIAIEGIKSFPGFENVDIPPLLFKNMYQSSFSITLPVYNGGLLTNNLEMAKILRESDRVNLKSAESEITLQTAKAYYNFAQSKEFIRVRQKALELAQRNLKNARAKNELGLRPKSDILRWESQVASEESNLIEAENAVEIAKVSLANLIGIDILEDIDVVEMSESEFLQSKTRFANAVSGDMKSQLNRLYDEALKNNHEKQLTALQTNISQNAEKAARSGFLPQINFAYNYSWQGNDTPALDGFKSWDAAFQLSYPIFNGFGNVSDLQKARAEVQRSKKLEQDYDRNIMLSIFIAFNTIKTSLARITLFEKNLTQAADNLKLIQNRYNLGLASNIDLIDAQVLETTAQVNLVNSRYDLLIAGAELERTLGKPVDGLENFNTSKQH